MFCRNCFLIVILACAGAAYGQKTQAVPTQTARADIINAQAQKIGTATLTQTDSGVRIDLEVAQLPPGTHAIHIHNVGKCDPPAFTTAGGHFNPYMKKHGKDNPDGPHAGDMLNIEVGPDGTVKTSLVDTMVTLSDGPNSLFHEGGTSLVIHAGPDDYKTDPAGNSGARIACGIVQK